MVDQTLLPDPTCLHLLQLEAEGKVITATVKTRAPEARCPLCAGRSEKVHSHYLRVLADLPWMGYAVRLKLHTRRFFCPNPECQRQIFDFSVAWCGSSLCSSDLSTDRCFPTSWVRARRGGRQATRAGYGACHQSRYASAAHSSSFRRRVLYSSGSWGRRLEFPPGPQVRHDPHRPGKAHSN